MAQRSVEILIGRLVTDEAFREAFLAEPRTTLVRFGEAGHELTPLEIAVVLSMPRHSWNTAAGQIDPRLQKADLSRDRTR